jgi:superfamily II RNA helicase
MWCSKMTDVYEGSLIRLFRRLEELLRQIAQASKVMGSEELEQKFTAALELIRRDLGKCSHVVPALSSVNAKLNSRSERTVTLFVI